MTPAMAEAVEYLRAWHDKAKATTDLDRYPALLGEAPASPSRMRPTSWNTAEPAPRCEGSQLDEAWGFTFASERPGYSKVRIAYGAHAATRPLVDVELPTEAADLLSDVLGGRIRRGLILRDKR